MVKRGAHCINDGVLQPAILPWCHTSPILAAVNPSNGASPLRDQTLSARRVTPRISLLWCCMRSWHSVVGHYQFARKNNNNGQKGKSRLADGQNLVATWVFKVLVFVIFCNSTQQRAGGTRACPGCVVVPYFIRLVPRCSTLLRKVTHARFAVRGPSKGGFMVLPLVNRHVRPKSQVRALAQRRSVSAGRSTHLPVYTWDRSVATPIVRSWHPYAWSDLDGTAAR